MQSSKSIVVILCYLFCKGVYSQSTLPPYWVQSSVETKFLPEDTQIGTRVASIKATGRNGVNVHIERLDTTTKQRVTMNCTEGLTTVCDVHLEEELDRDTGVSEWILFFRAYDEKINIEHVPDQILRIIMLDVNDTPPKFDVPFYQANVKEDALKNKVILKVTAEDPDNGAGGVIQYSLQNSDQDQNIVVQVDSSTGVVTLTSTLDYEIRSYYKYYITASDKGIPSLSATATLILRVTDVQDTPPVFSKSSYYTTLDFHSPTGTFVLSTRAREGDLPSPVKYQFSNVETHRNDCTNKFGIDERSGAIYTAKALTHSEICGLVVEAYQGDKHSAHLGITASHVDVIVALTSIDNPFG